MIFAFFFRIRTMKIRQLFPSNFFQRSKSKKKKSSSKLREVSKEIEKVSDSLDHVDTFIGSRENSISNLVDIHSNLDTLFETLRSRANRAHATQQTSETDLNSSVVVYENIGQYNSLKPRTRIRTNPWIQVPTTDLCIYQPTLDDRYDDSFDETNINIGHQTEFNVYETLVVRDFPDEHNKSEAKENFEFISKRKRRSADSKVETHYRWSIISEGDISIDWECHTLEEDWQQGDISYNYHAPYENDLDLVLEQGMSEADYTRVSIEDLLQEFVYETGCNENMDNDIDIASYEDGSDASSVNSFHITSLHNVNGESIMQESLDAGYASLTRDGTLSTDEEDKTEPENAVTQSQSDSGEMTTPEGDISAAGKIDFPEVNVSSERTLPEVKQSLQEKINQLRLEKLVMQNKIKEAQEEETARMEQRKILRGKHPADRKLSLFKTLIDLKERLENQTMRIQRSYSTVLTMQKNFSRQKAPVLCVSTQITL